MKKYTFGSTPVVILMTCSMPALAQSSVTLYGTAAEQLEYATNAPSRFSMAQDPYLGTKFGMKGVEDLGGGIKAVFQLEGGVDLSNGQSLQGTATSSYGSGGTPNGSGRLFGRTAAVGLSSRYGTLTFGRQFTIADGMMNRMYPRGNPNTTDYNLTAAQYIPWNDNEIKYVGQFGGFGFGTSYTLSNDGSGKAFDVGGSYTRGPIDLVVFYREDNNADPETVKRRLIGIGGSYALTKKLGLYFGYLNRTDSGDPEKNNIVLAGLAYTITPALSASVGYVHDTQSGSAALDGKRQIIYGDLVYLLSKQTSVYAMFGQDNVMGNYALPVGMLTHGGQAKFGIGIRHLF